MDFLAVELWADDPDGDESLTLDFEMFQDLSQNIRAAIEFVGGPDTETVDPGELVQRAVRVENTGDVTHEFFVGYSAVSPEKREVFDGPGGSVELAPGEGTEVDREVTIPPEAPAAAYTLVTAVWEESDPDELETRLDEDRREAHVELNPQPRITSTDVTVENETETEDGHTHTITVAATNDGPTAQWQSLAVSLPDASAAADIEIVESTFNQENIVMFDPGTRQRGEYGLSEVELDYPLVRGFAVDWEKDETNTIEISVSPEQPSEQAVYVKSLAIGPGVAASDPPPGDTDVIDQQNEYVYREASESPADGEDRVHGRILQPDGSPAARHTLVMMAEDSVIEVALTDEEGRFSYDRPDVAHDIQYNQMHESSPDNSRPDPEGTPYPRDGTPDLFAVARLEPSDSGDLGTIQLPEAYPLDVRVVERDGTPLEVAAVVVRHVSGDATAGFGAPADENGYYNPLDDNNVTGIEVRGEIHVTVSPPGYDDEYVDAPKERELEVTEPTEITVTFTLVDETGPGEVTGRILQHNGAPAARHTLVIYRVADKVIETWATTDEDGAFSYDVQTDQRYDVQYYQLYDINIDNNQFDPDGPPGPRDGVPDLFALTQHQGASSLHTLELPRAYPLDIRVVDQDGDPIEHARVTVEHYSDDDEADAGFGPRLTNGDSYFVWGNTAGIELRGEVSIVVRPPEGSNNFDISEKERELEVTESTAVEITLPKIDP